MSDLEGLNNRFLRAQSVFERNIRESDELEFLSRFGFMATEICLMVLEDTSMPVAEICERIARIFAQLSEDASNLPTQDASDLADTFRICHTATLKLSELTRTGDKSSAHGSCLE